MSSDDPDLTEKMRAWREAMLADRREFERQSIRSLNRSERRALKREIQKAERGDCT